MKITLNIGWKDVATVREPTRVGRHVLKHLQEGDEFLVTKVRLNEIELTLMPKATR